MRGAARGSPLLTPGLAGRVRSVHGDPFADGHQCCVVHRTRRESPVVAEGVAISDQPFGEEAQLGDGGLGAPPQELEDGIIVYTAEHDEHRFGLLDDLLGGVQLLQQQRFGGCCPCFLWDGQQESYATWQMKSLVCLARELKQLGNGWLSESRGADLVCA